MTDVRTPLTNKGYFFMQRGWMSSTVFKNEAYTEREAWAYLIENATYQPQVWIFDGIQVSLCIGELVASCRYLAKAWTWKHDKVNRYLRKLESIGWVTLTTDYGKRPDSSQTAFKGKYDRRSTLIKINHYNQLQKKEGTKDSANNLRAVTANQTALGQQPDKYN